jgi:putative endonuclease
MDRFYTGATSLSIKDRLERHLTKFYAKKFTATTSDWELFYQIPCSSLKQAMNIEKHIKRMKSKMYIQNLKEYPALAEKLQLRYDAN